MMMLLGKNKATFARCFYHMINLGLHLAAIRRIGQLLDCLIVNEQYRQTGMKGFAAGTAGADLLDLRGRRDRLSAYYHAHTGRPGRLPGYIPPGVILPPATNR